MLQGAVHKEVFCSQAMQMSGVKTGYVLEKVNLSANKIKAIQRILDHQVCPNKL
jgi:hypothetical protein